MCGRNASNKDKRRQVEAALRANPAKSNREIARETVTTHPFVARMLTEDGNCYHRSLNSGSILISTWNTRGTIPRQFLGRGTSVNKAVAESIKTPTEHKYFPAFDNGVTILCKSLTASDKTIEISGYAVVNGCQSITSLYENAASITPDLRMITKFHRSGAGFPARY
jgi:AIPR protein